MVKRLLTALQYPKTQSVDINDDNTFKEIILWLETNKLQCDNSNLVNNLKNINDNQWFQYFNDYKKELGCPVLSNRLEELHWLLGNAVQKEYHNNKDIYLKHAINNLEITTSPNVVAENPLDNLDFHSQEFANEITKLAKLLIITPHPNHLLTLKAISKLITTRLTPEALENPKQFIIDGKPFPIQEADLGLDLKDNVLNQAAKVLRLLYIQDLRNLQTTANELIVAVQNITADPKTDTKLGKVGK